MIRNILTSTIILLVLSTVPVQAIDSGASLKIAEEVQNLINAQQYDNALARVDVALKKHKKSDRLQLQKGFILIRQGNLKTAENYYKKIKRKLKKNAEPGNNLAMIYRMQGRYRESIDLFKDVIKKFPDYAQAYENLGDTYIELASKQYQLSNEKFPDNANIISKSEISTNFSQVAFNNTLAGKRQALANQQTVSSTNNQTASEKKSTKQPQLASIQDQIMGTLQTWATAWSERQPNNYLSHYSKEYTPQNSIDLNTWVADRKTDLAAIKYIVLRLESIKVMQHDANNVTANFIENFEAPNRAERALKSLTFKRYQDRWLIIKEEKRAL